MNLAGTVSGIAKSTVLPIAIVTPPYLTDIYNKVNTDVFSRIHLHMPKLPEWKHALGGAW